jgi:asparagine synthase (glutamine-hydrolysing)
VEFAASIPARFKISLRRQKIVLREAFRPLLPDAIYEKPKTGFSIPLGQWLSGPLAETVRDTLYDGRFRQRNIVSMDFLRRIVEEHLEQQRNWTHLIWSLLVLEWWFRAHVD